MLLEVAAHTRDIGHDVDPVPAELLGRTDAGQQEQLGRLDSTGADHDLLVHAGRVRPPLPPVLDPYGAVAVEDDPIDEHVCLHSKVSAPPHDAQVGSSGGVTKAPAHVGLAVADALLVRRCSRQ